MLYSAAFLVAIALAAVIASLAPAAGRGLLMVVIVGFAVAGGVVGSIPVRRRLRASAPALNRPANPAVTRVRRWMWTLLAWTFLLVSGLGALWATGHALIAIVVLISYALLTYLLPLVVVLERFRRKLR